MKSLQITTKFELDHYFIMLYQLKNCCIPLKVIDWKPQFSQNLNIKGQSLSQNFVDNRHFQTLSVFMMLYSSAKFDELLNQ